MLIKWRARCVYGLSPLTRGTRSRALGGTLGLRFIPADAGNTGDLVCGLNPLAVYPR